MYGRNKKRKQPENIKVRDHLGDLDISGRIILKGIVMQWDVNEWSALLWLRSGSCGRLL
jgi:hypothetical protein